MPSALAPSATIQALSVTLRHCTRDAHVRAERVFIKAAKARPGSGPDLLMALNHGLASWLDGASGALEEPRLAAEMRVFVDAVLEAHLADPGRDDGGAGPPHLSIARPVLAGEAEVAGAAYAICGSTLGASVLADAWRDDTRPHWVRFCAASRSLERRWPAFSAALDAWGLRHGPCGEAGALAGAVRAFDHAGALVAALAPSHA